MASVDDVPWDQVIGLLHELIVVLEEGVVFLMLPKILIGNAPLGLGTFL